MASLPPGKFVFGERLANQYDAMLQIVSDTRVPVINLRDRSRLTGRDAPTLRNLAAWLSENPNFVIDMPPPTSAMLGALVSAPSPSSATSALLMEGELEPGEIVRSGQRNRSPVRAESPGIDPSQHHVTVWNRKNGLKLSGTKGPTLSNLAMWLEKNPDWDVDPTCLDIAKKVRKLWSPLWLDPTNSCFFVDQTARETETVSRKPYQFQAIVSSWRCQQLINIRIIQLGSSCGFGECSLRLVVFTKSSCHERELGSASSRLISSYGRRIGSIAVIDAVPVWRSEPCDAWTRRSGRRNRWCCNGLWSDESSFDLWWPSNIRHKYIASAINDPGSAKHLVFEEGISWFIEVIDQFGAAES